MDKTTFEAALGLARRGMPFLAIARHIGCARSTLEKHLTRAGFTQADRRAIVEHEKTMKTVHRLMATDRRHRMKHGIGIVEARSIENASLFRRYLKQRQTAGIRGIGWELTFPEWLGVWTDSGLLEKRGRGSQKFVMARRGDVGPYAIGNVSIISYVDNIKEGWKTSPLRVRLSAGFGQRCGARSVEQHADK